MFNQLMKQAQQMQERLADMQAQLEVETVTGTSAGGMVQVTINGKGNMCRLEIDPDLIKPEEAAVLSDLIIAAHNDAKVRLEAKVNDIMREATGGLPIPPGLFSHLS